MASSPKKEDGSTNGPQIKVDFLQQDKVAVISLNRPTKMNALSFELFAEFEKVFEKVLSDASKEVRCIVLTSTSQHFTAGLDLQSAMQIG